MASTGLKMQILVLGSKMGSVKASKCHPSSFFTLIDRNRVYGYMLHIFYATLRICVSSYSYTNFKVAKPP